MYAQTEPAKKALAAIYKIVAEYEKIYDKTVRKQGHLSFNDMTISIAKSQNPVERKFAEYRFDSSTKHWLFDEFQDTSRLQWEVFKDIIDEAIQDPEKSFYFVGDIKQSIYGWRGGEWMHNWERDCRSSGIQLACDSVICNEAPDDAALAACQALGKALVG